MNIRKAKQEDTKNIIKIIESVHINNVKNRDNGFLASKDLSESTYERMIKNYDYCYVCELEDRVVGFLIAASIDLMDKKSEIYSLLLGKNLSKDFIYIFQIGVDVNFQRMGVAKSLYAKLFEETEGKRLVVITSKDPFNKASRELHLKLGFKDIDVFEWTDGTESFVYNKKDHRNDL